MLFMSWKKRRMCDEVLVVEEDEGRGVVVVVGVFIVMVSLS